MPDALERVMTIGVIALSPCAVLFWIRMLEECLTREEGTAKFLWCVVLTGAHVLGAMLYFFSVYRPRHAERRASS